MSDHSVSCTIVNQTGGTMVLAGSAPNSGTKLDISDSANEIETGVTCADAFTGSNSVTTGCGGTVTYTLPNNTDVLVIAYNTSTGNINTYCYPTLQSNSPENAGCDAYWCTASGSVSLNDDNGVTTTITVYKT